MSVDSGFDATACARDVAPFLKARAAAVDEAGTFPQENIERLRAAGLLGMNVPAAYGGPGVGVTEVAGAARILAGACLSTAMILAMHLQQVACLVDYADESLKARLLPRVAAGEVFVASVTSERGKGGHLLTALAPLACEDGQVIVEREAPTCTGGAYGEGFLITMRRDAASPPNAVELVYAERAQLEVTVQSAWEALGMRGTASIGLTLRGRLPEDQVLRAPGGFKQIALTTMVPIGHIVWASCWLGAVQEALRGMQQVLRDPHTRQGYTLQSDLFLERWARLRLEVDTVEAYLEKVVREYEQARACGLAALEYNAARYNIQLNNLKILASERLFAAINQLIQLAGLRYGYLKNKDLPLERIMRDLRSASLMYANERLLLANGTLALIDRS